MSDLNITRAATEAWAALYRAQATIQRELVEAGAREDLLPAEYGVLHALSTAPDGLRGTDLSADVLLSQAGTSRLTGRLEKRDLIERGGDPDDARACRFRLTEQGRTVQRRVGATHARHIVTVMTRALTTDQLEILRELCSTLIETPDARKPENRP